jgi:hypothetical protein
MARSYSRPPSFPLSRWLARGLHLDPIHHLQRRWGKKLTVFTTGPGTTSDH